MGAHENTDPNYRKDVLQMFDMVATWPNGCSTAESSNDNGDRLLAPQHSFHARPVERVEPSAHRTAGVNWRTGPTAVVARYILWGRRAGRPWAVVRKRFERCWASHRITANWEQSDPAVWTLCQVSTSHYLHNVIIKSYICTLVINFMSS